jgi:hypothetical protein
VPLVDLVKLALEDLGVKVPKKGKLLELTPHEYVEPPTEPLLVGAALEAHLEEQRAALAAARTDELSRRAAGEEVS